MPKARRHKHRTAEKPLQHGGRQPGFTAIEVERRGPPEHLAAIPRDGGGCLQISADRLEIVVGLPRITDAEVATARRGPMQIGLLRHGDALFLVLAASGFGTLDLPYDHSKVPVGERGLPDRLPHQSFAFTLHLYDTASGVSKGMRLFSVTPQFANVLAAEIVKLDERVAAPDYDYRSAVADSYRRWPDVRAMLRDAQYVETVGMAFPNEVTRPPPPPDAH